MFRFLALSLAAALVPPVCAQALGGFSSDSCRTSASLCSPAVWINEVHHSNAGVDVGEGVELAGAAGTPLDGYRVWTYSGYGTLYAVGADGVDSLAVAFHGSIDDEGGGLGAVWAPAARLRGGCQGLALTDPAGRLVQFLSTGGCRFNALAGPVFDAAEGFGAGSPQHPDSLVWSAGIAGPRSASGTPRRVQEWGTMPPGYSLQLSGAGRASTDFAWTGPLPASPGRLNDYQAPTPARTSGIALDGRQVGAFNRVSGWHGGLPIPAGLDAPLVDAGTDEDDARSCPALDAERPALNLGLPSPNPARRAIRVALDAPLRARLAAVVVDALGRTVLRLSPPPSPLTLDVSRLAPGVYVLRVTMHPGEAASQPTVASRRFTVAP